MVQLATAITLCCAAVLSLATGPAAEAATTETVLYSFTGNNGDGASPNAGLVADSAGNLYGTTVYGGASSAGTVFKLTPGGTATVLYSFTGGSDGGNPYGGLIADSSGNLYGTTQFGGASGAGVVFRLSPGGVFTALHSLDWSEGAFPQARLLADSTGNLYGTAWNGGSSSCGTVFKLSPSGTLTVLYSFTCTADGGHPYSDLLADSGGNLYGTTADGGAFNAGTVFKLSSSGAETVLYSFSGNPDGANPHAGLTADSAGNLYGTTVSGGVSNAGTVFKLSPSGTESVLYSFLCGADGANPYADLILDSAGSLYGTSTGGCAASNGTVFKVTSGGTTMLYSFTGGADGAIPYAPLLADSTGNLYGTTYAGGTSFFGTVFKLAGTGFVTTPPSVPFSAFTAALGVEFGRRSNTDAFQLVAKFSLGQASNGINPPGEAVTLRVGTFATTIPPGSFKGSRSGSSYFVGAIGGVELQLVMVPVGAHQYLFTAAAERASLTGTADPVSVALTIGDDTGTVSVNAAIAH